MAQNKFRRSKERKKLRFSNFHYSSEAFYFLTICTKNRNPFFGNIQNKKIVLNPLGYIAQKYWKDIPKHFPNIGIDAFIIMPNHIHGVLKIKKSGLSDICRGRRSASPTPSDRSKMLIPKIIQQFKSSVTRKINHCFPEKIFRWQRSYYDHIIRNELSLKNIQEYIRINPEQWKNDEFFID